MTTPRLVITDYSWAIILACLREFCGSNLSQYLDRTYRIVTGTANADDLNKTIIHICLAHVMNMSRREVNKIFASDIDRGSKTHFAMRIMACLVNARDLLEAEEIIGSCYIVMNNEFSKNNARITLNCLEKK